MAAIVLCVVDSLNEFLTVLITFFCLSPSLTNFCWHPRHHIYQWFLTIFLAASQGNSGEFLFCLHVAHWRVKSVM